MTAQRVVAVSTRPEPRELRLLRAAAVLALVVVVAAAVAGFVLPPRRSALAAPAVVALVAVAVCLWLGATATGDAGRRLDRVKRAYAVEGDRSRLLRRFLVAYLLVLARLEGMAAAGVVAALWGGSPPLGLMCQGLAAVMIALAWPTRAKLELLVARADELRP